MAETKKRPIAPHLMDGIRPHWRWGPAMFISILHRVTGNGLAIVGLGTLLCWLGALAGGPESYAAFSEQVGTWYGMTILVGVSWAFFSHMASGLRHFVMDIGAGFELGRNNLWSILTPVIGVILTAAFWAAVLN